MSATTLDTDTTPAAHHVAGAGTVDVVELLRDAIDQAPDAVRAALAMEPCHITGSHEPDHHLKYTCAEQRAQMLARLLSVIGATEDNLPRALHANCYWCQQVPSQEKYRARQRQTYTWAGVPVAGELAETAPDGWHPGDDEAYLAAHAALAETTGADTWHTRSDVQEQLKHHNLPDLPFERIALLERKLVDHGLIEVATSGRHGTRLVPAG